MPSQSVKTKVQKAKSFLLGVAVFIILAVVVSFSQGGDSLEGNLLFSPEALETNLVKEEQIQTSEEMFAEAIMQRKTSFFEPHISGIEGGTRFLEDIRNVKEVIDLLVTKSESGIFMSFLGRTEDSTLFHPYYGFFVQKENIVTDFFWGGESYATLQEVYSLKNEQYLLELINMGPYPWLMSDEWKNEITGETVQLVPSGGEGSIHPGEKGGVLYSGERNIVLTNSTRGFQVIFE